MSEYAKVREDAFKSIQKDAGMILSKFDPKGATKIADADILFTTSGGVNPSCKYNFIDFGEDIDNVPNGTKELMEVDSVDCQMTFTVLDTTVQAIKTALGAADSETVTGATGGTLTKITPRSELKQTDFKDIWWVGPTTNGGFAACCLKNALSIDGFSIQTTKKEKGKISVTLKGHYSIDNVDEVPMEFYVFEKAEESTSES